MSIGQGVFRMPNQVNVRTVLLESDVIRAERNGSNVIIGLMDKDDNPVVVTNQEYASVGALLAATPATNTVALLSPDAFTGTGKPTAGVPVIYNGTDWEPLGGRQKIFKCMFGTKSAPTKTVSANGRFTLATEPIIPGGLLAANGHGFEVLGRVQKHAANGTATFKIWLGTNATYTNNSIIVAWPVTNTDGMSSTAHTKIIRTSATTLFTSNYAPDNNNAGANIFGDRNTLVDFTANQYLTFAMDVMSAGDSFDLLEISGFWTSGAMA